eukprot:6593903-Alexandrium_andersonii.AAC.1
MSASLVGSEMCIRDRPHPCGCRPLSLRIIAGGCESCRCPSCGRSRGVPVSYTHLTLPTICSV